MYMAEEWQVCVYPELLKAAAGEGRTVNHDWSSKRRGRFSPGKIRLVLVAV